MAGLLLLLGFVAKEAAFSAFLELSRRATRGPGSPSSGRSSGRCRRSPTRCASSGGAFFTKADAAATSLHAERPAIGVAPGILAAASVVAAFAVPWIEPLLAGYADELPAWRTTSPSGRSSLVCTSRGGLRTGAVLGGVGGESLACRRGWRRSSTRRGAIPASSRSSIESLRRSRPEVRAPRVARLPCDHRGGVHRCSAPVLYLEHGVARRHPPLGPPGVAIRRLCDEHRRDRRRDGTPAHDGGAARERHRLRGLVLLFGMSGAPDLALTQALVETIVIVVFVLVLRRLPKQIASVSRPVPGGPCDHRRARGHRHGGHRARRARRAHPSERLPPSAPPRTRPRGARQEHRANVMLVDIRVGHPRRDLGARRRRDGCREPHLRVGPHAAHPVLDDRDDDIAPGTGGASGSSPCPSGRRASATPRTRSAHTEGERGTPQPKPLRADLVLAGRTTAANRSILIEVLVWLSVPLGSSSRYPLFVGQLRPRRRVRGRTSSRGPRTRWRATSRADATSCEAAPVDAGAWPGTVFLLGGRHRENLALLRRAGLRVGVARDRDPLGRARSPSAPRRSSTSACTSSSSGSSSTSCARSAARLTGRKRSRATRARCAVR